MTICAVMTTGIRGLLERNNRFIAGVAAVCVGVGSGAIQRVAEVIQFMGVFLVCFFLPYK
jgi:hypothetical protein